MKFILHTGFERREEMDCRILTGDCTYCCEYKERQDSNGMIVQLTNIVKLTIIVKLECYENSDTNARTQVLDESLTVVPETLEEDNSVVTEQPTEPEVPEPFFWTCPDFATNQDNPFDRIRKDYNELTGPERELYIQAINTAKERGYYDMFVAIHKYQTNDDYAHGTSGMLERIA